MSNRKMGWIIFPGLNITNSIEWVAIPNLEGAFGMSGHALRPEVANIITTAWVLFVGIFVLNLVYLVGGRVVRAHKSRS